MPALTMAELQERLELERMIKVRKAVEILREVVASYPSEGQDEDLKEAFLNLQQWLDEQEG